MTTDMNQHPITELPIIEEKIPAHTKKMLKLISVLVACGIFVGLILSYFFVDEANNQIIGGPGIYFRVNPLTSSEILFPSLGVIIICISMFLLIGLIAVYIKVFVKTGSKYIAGLLFFLAPLFVQSIFSIITLRSLFISAAIPNQFQQLRESIGFGVGGFGGILVILSIFEIIGLTILLYLSTE
jgi:hypothetical protein